MKPLLLNFVSYPGRKSHLKVKSLALILFFFTSCITTLEIHPEYKKKPPKINYNVFTHLNQHVFFFGIINPSPPVNVQELCKESTWQMVKITRPYLIY